MLRSASKIIGYRLHALDGEIGRAVDFLIDEQSWLVRYVVVQGGAWIDGRRVLIAPEAVRKGDWTSRRMVINGTRELVEAAPFLGDDAPLSRAHEYALARHYGWVLGGAFESLWAEAVEAPPAEPAPLIPSDLRSLSQLLGYGIAADDGLAGNVEDFIVDDDTWTCRYMVIDGKSWLTPKRTLVPTDWVETVSTEERQLQILAPISKIQDAPEYDPSAPVYHRVEADESRDSDSGIRSVPSARERERPSGLQRSWRLPPPVAWGTRGLKAALARIIHG